MKKLLSGLLAASFVAASAIPLNAAPIFVPKTPVPANAIEQVQFGPNWRHRHGPGFRRYNDGYYYNGYRGFRHSRRGYREHNGWWFPAAAFVAGALITGAINSDRASSGSSHVDWCYDHYRSYRASDNTYQPTRGMRRQCNSPYD